MKQLNRFSIGLTVGLGMLSLVALVTSYAQSGGVIKGCYNQNNGQLRIVSDASQCRQNEAAISWNMQGPQGAPGPQGPPGADTMPLADHHKELAASVPNAQDLVFPLPKVDAPVKIDVMVSGIKATLSSGVQLNVAPAAFTFFAAVDSSTEGVYLANGDSTATAVVGSSDEPDPVMETLPPTSSSLITVTLERPANNVRIHTTSLISGNVTSQEVKYSVNMWY